MHGSLPDLYARLAQAIAEEDTATAARLCRESARMLDPSLSAEVLGQAIPAAELCLVAVRELRRACLSSLHQVQRAQEYRVAAE